jgi:hypothetical protein
MDHRRNATHRGRSPLIDEQETMNSRNKIDIGIPANGRETKVRIEKRNLGSKRRETISRRRRIHDPMLVFNMSIFNYTDGWSRTFNPLKSHERGI